MFADPARDLGRIPGTGPPVGMGRGVKPPVRLQLLVQSVEPYWPDDTLAAAPRSLVASEQSDHQPLREPRRKGHHGLAAVSIQKRGRPARPLEARRNAALAEEPLARDGGTLGEKVLETDSWSTTAAASR